MIEPLEPDFEAALQAMEQTEQAVAAGICPDCTTQFAETLRPGAQTYCPCCCRRVKMDNAGEIDFWFMPTPDTLSAIRCSHVFTPDFGRWIDLGGFTVDDYERAFGHRNFRLFGTPEHAASEAAIAGSEMPICCASISDLRDELIAAQEAMGTWEILAERMARYLNICAPKLGENSALRAILRQLGVDLHPGGRWLFQHPDDR